MQSLVLQKLSRREAVRLTLLISAILLCRYTSIVCTSKSLIYCTDGAPAMLGCRSGFQTLVKQKSPNIIGTHCTIHRQALMVKTMPDEFKNVLNGVITAVNFIKSNVLNSCLFAELCKESDSEFETLLLHSKAFQRESSEESFRPT